MYDKDYLDELFKDLKPEDLKLIAYTSIIFSMFVLYQFLNIIPT